MDQSSIQENTRNRENENSSEDKESDSLEEEEFADFSNYLPNTSHTPEPISTEPQAPELIPEPVVIKSSVPEPPISEDQGSLTLVVRSQPSQAHKDSDSSSTWIEDDFEGVDAARGRALHIEVFDFQPLNLVTPTSTLRIEEIQEPNTEDTRVPVPEVSKKIEASSDVVTRQIDLAGEADAAVADAVVLATW
nr:hypothetical protein Iba_chr01aCG4090 [Ipomoea batatas]